MYMTCNLKCLHSVSNCGEKNVLGEQSNDFVKWTVILSSNLNCFMNVKVDLSVSQQQMPGVYDSL